MTTETELMPECGRLVFRGVELAYLNINGKKMLPLAEMLALVFRSTPRTTLFTRMEKIKAQRYFCQPLEIKMLKKVNGIHGSSANCTLIPEEDVERYCTIYMDRNPDGLAYSAGPRELGEVARTDEQIKAVETNDNANLGKESKIAAHRGKPANFEMRATEFGAREINTTEMSSRNTQAVSSNKRERNSDAVNDDGGNLTSPLSLDQEHTSNSTQTISMLSWSTKKQAANIVDDLEVNKNAKTKRTKKRNRAVGAGKLGRKFNSPSDEHKKFPGKGEISQRSTSTTENSPKLRKRRNLTLNLDSGFSDDSGFTSLTFEDYISPSKVQKLETQEKLKIVDEASPLGPKKQRKKKKKKSGIGLTDDLNLSPPPLVIKKLQNTWQVETKLDGVKKSLYKPTNEEEKNLLPVNGVVGKHSSAKAQSPKKKKQQRKLADGDVQCTAASRNIQGKKNRRPGPRNVADACASGATVIPEQECLTTPDRKKKVLKNGAKKLKVGGRLESLNTTSASQAVMQGPSSMSKPLKHAAPAGTKLTPVKPPVLKATPNFSFMDLFPSTCRLVIRDGDVCPEFTMACPSDVAKPHPSHPVWKWRLGGPVITKTHRVSFRIRKIKQPNKPAVSDGSQAKASSLSRTAPLP